MVKVATTLGAAALVALIGGAVPAHAASTAPAPTTSQETSSQTLVLKPTQSFAMVAKPSVKATPYWGEKKPG